MSSVQAKKSLVEPPGAGQFGTLLRQWRLTRRLSQLDLALEADVSAKHVSFLETGRSQPSRSMVLRLAEVLDVPVRQRNTLLRTAGFSAYYAETQWQDPQLDEIRRSIERLIQAHDPYPAIVCDHNFNVHMQNVSSGLLMQGILSAEALASLGDSRPNLLQLLFHPQGFRPAIANWPEVGAAMIQRLHRDVALRGDEEGTELLKTALAQPDVPPDWRFPDLESELQVVVPLHVKTDRLDLRFFTAITTIGSALDITLRELVIETFLPADDETSDQLRAMAAEASQAEQ